MSPMTRTLACVRRSITVELSSAMINRFSRLDLVLEEAACGVPS
jgi:hypothetical protein